MGFLDPRHRQHHPVLAFVLALLLLFSTCALGRQAKENRRDFQKLDGDALDRLAALHPPQWESVNEGHLQRMLIPRAGESSSMAFGISKAI